MNYRWIVVITAALAAGALAAIVLPRMTDSESTSWLVTLAVAVVVGVIVAFATRERTEEGETHGPS